MVKLNPLKGGTGTSLRLLSHTYQYNDPDEVQVLEAEDSQYVQNSKAQTKFLKDKKASKKAVTRVSFHTGRTDEGSQIERDLCPCRGTEKQN